MSIRKVTKALAGKEDLLLGNELHTQQRGNQEVVVKGLSGEDIPRTSADSEKLETGMVRLDKEKVQVVNTMADLLAVDKSKFTIVQLLGFHERGDGGGGVFYWDTNQDKANHNGGTVIDPDNLANLGSWDSASQTAWFTPGEGAGCWVREYSGTVNVKWFGVTNNDVDTTIALSAVIDFMQSGELFFPKGVYKYSSLPDILAKPNVTYIGEGSEATILHYTGSGTAFYMNAFFEDSPNQTFKHNCNIKGLTIRGDNAEVLLRIRGVANSVFSDIRVNGTGFTTGSVDRGAWKTGGPTTKGFWLDGCQLNNFTNCYCSYHGGDVPYNGWWFTNTAQNTTTTGGSSNNNLNHCYGEGNGIGCYITTGGGSQNQFIGGAFEACFDWGLLTGALVRYNTFIGTGFENKNATGDIKDNGKYLKLINCYSSKKTVLQGIDCKIDGGYYEYIRIEGVAQNPRISRVTTGHWNTGLSGISNLSDTTKTELIYDSISASYIKDKRESMLRFVPTILNDVTGDGTKYLISTFDTGYDYLGNATSNGFIAKTDGVYDIKGKVLIQNIESAATYAILYIDTPSQSFQTKVPLDNVDDGGVCSISVDCSPELNKGDAVTMSILVSGGTKIVDVVGHLSNLHSFLSMVKQAY